MTFESITVRLQNMFKTGAHSSDHFNPEDPKYLTIGYLGFSY